MHIDASLCVEPRRVVKLVGVLKSASPVAAIGSVLGVEDIVHLAKQTNRGASSRERELVREVEIGGGVGLERCLV